MKNQSKKKSREKAFQFMLSNFEKLYWEIY